MKLSKGDQVIYKGHLYWVAFSVTFGNGKVGYFLRQAHWPDDHFVLAWHSEVVPDIPFTA